MMKRVLLVLSGVMWAASAFAQRDAIDLSQAIVHNSPADIASWAKTTRISTLTMRPPGPADGLSFDAASHMKWPDYTPPGWDGPIQYTVWAGVKLSDGKWHIAGIQQMWRDRESTGAPLLSYGPGCTVNNFACNWVYDARWGAMAGYQPRAGEAMVFFLSAGNARGVGTVTSVRERSNVVIVNLPPDDNAVFNFAATATSTKTPSDFDGDGKSDVVIFRPSTGAWYLRFSSTSFGTWAFYQWGGSGDVPIDGDFDGDGRADIAVYRPSTGAWYVRFSASGYGSWALYQWGAPSDIPVAADYDGDGRTDAAFYRPSTGAWWIRFATGNWTTVSWSTANAIPLAGDFDGDGKADLTLFRPTDGVWYILTWQGTWGSYQWGTAGDSPYAADVDCDGKSDLLVFRPSSGTWYGRFSSTGYSTSQTGSYPWGAATDVPLKTDFDGDGKADIAMFRPSTGEWLIRYSSTTYTSGTTLQWGGSFDIPLPR